MRAALAPTLALLLVACAAHPAAAAGPATLEATLGGALVDGSLALDGPLSALASTGRVDPQAAPTSVLSPGAAQDSRVAPTALRLAARHLQAETDVRRQDGSPFAGPRQDAHESQGFDAAVAHALQARPGFQIYLAPWPGHPAPTAHLEALQAELGPAAAPPGEGTREVPSAQPSLNATGATVLVAGGLRTLHVEGDLALTLWEWDLQVSSQDTLLRSGYAYTPWTPSVGGVDTTGTSEARQVFLYATGATLDLTLPLGASVAVALQPRAADLDGRLVVQRPSGTFSTLAGTQALHDGDWVDGAFTAEVADVSAASFHAVLHGTGRAAQLAGLSVAIAPPVPSQTGALVATAAASGIAVLGSWRLWGRRPDPAAVPDAVAASLEDERAALGWLDASAAQDPSTALWDSDLMRAFDWSAERAQGTLRSLRAKGQVRCKDVAMAGGRSSIGRIALTAAGLDRLREGGDGARPAQPHPAAPDGR